MGEYIEVLLTSDQNHEEWKRLTSCYSQVSRGQSPPSQKHLELIATKQVELYRYRPHEGIRAPILVTLEALEDGILGGEEVSQAVWSLKRVRAGGPSVMRMEDLKDWFRGASRETDPVTHWWRLLEIFSQKTL